MARENEWLRVVYGEAARKIEDREAARKKAREQAQRQSDKKSAYPESSAPEAPGAARPL